MLKEDDSISSGEVETQTPHMSGQQENINRRISQTINQGQQVRAASDTPIQLIGQNQLHHHLNYSLHPRRNAYMYFHSKHKQVTTPAG